MGKRVLLVEDEANILEAISFILSRDGWEVHGHGNGATALEEIARHVPDVVVLDVMLPGRSGIDILRALRGEPGTADLPVLMLTAKGQSRDRDLAMSLGANAYLTKPFSNAEMLETLHLVATGVTLGRAESPGVIAGDPHPMNWAEADEQTYLS